MVYTRGRLCDHGITVPECPAVSSWEFRSGAGSCVVVGVDWQGYLRDWGPVISRRTGRIWEERKESTWGSRGAETEVLWREGREWSNCTWTCT